MKDRQHFRRPAVPVGSTHVRVISVEQQQQIAIELNAALGKSPQEQAVVIAWAAEYADCYYYTAAGALRRVLPNAKLLQRKVRKHASGQSQANVSSAQ
jgi:hypothetical protein